MMANERDVYVKFKIVCETCGCEDVEIDFYEGRDGDDNETGTLTISCPKCHAEIDLD